MRRSTTGTGLEGEDQIGLNEGQNLTNERARAPDEVTDLDGEINHDSAHLQAVATSKHDSVDGGQIDEDGFIKDESGAWV